MQIRVLGDRVTLSAGWNELARYTVPVRHRLRADLLQVVAPFELVDPRHVGAVTTFHGLEWAAFIAEADGRNAKELSLTPQRGAVSWTRLDGLPVVKGLEMSEGRCLLWGVRVAEPSMLPMGLTWLAGGIEGELVAS